MYKHGISDSTTELASRSSSVSPWKIDAQMKSSPDLTMTGKDKPSLRTLLREFAQDTSSHGIGRIASAESIFWRIFWILVTLAGFSMVVYQGILLMENYLSKPVKSDIDVTYSRTVSFPAVTICNLNIIKRSFLHNFPEAQTIVGTFDNYMEGKQDGGEGGGGGNHHGGSSSGSNSSSSGGSSSGGSVSFGPPDQKREALMESLRIDSSDAEEDGSLSNVSVDAQAYAEDQIISMLAKYNDSVLTKGGHPFHELVYRCNWKDFNCKEGDFKKYWKTEWNWRYGNCFTFNSGSLKDGKKIPVLTSNKPGPKYGLTLDLFINQEEYIPSLSQEAGVRILLTPQRNIPFPVDEGFTVSPGFATSIGLRQLQITRVDPFNNGSCHSNDSLEDFSVYKEKTKGSKYSVQGCMYSCLARAQMELCNCTEGKFRLGNGICSETEQVKCVQEVSNKYENDDLGCAEKCPQSCTHMSYRASMSSSAWSQFYEKQIQAMMLRGGDADIMKMGKDKDMLRQNFLRIKIYFDELNMEKITYSEYYMAENLLSDIGGQLGLWIGVSAITVIEMLKLVLDISKVIFRKACYVSGNEVQDISLK